MGGGATSWLGRGEIGVRGPPPRLDEGETDSDEENVISGASSDEDDEECEDGAGWADANAVGAEVQADGSSRSGITQGVPWCSMTR